MPLEQDDMSDGNRDPSGFSEFDPRRVQDPAANHRAVVARSRSEARNRTLLWAGVAAVALVAVYFIVGASWTPNTAKDEQTRAAATVPADRSAGGANRDQTTGSAVPPPQREETERDGVAGAGPR